VEPGAAGRGGRQSDQDTRAASLLLARLPAPAQMDKAREFTRQKKKSQALMCLKKKKMYEQQLERIDALVSRRGGVCSRVCGCVWVWVCVFVCVCVFVRACVAKRVLWEYARAAKGSTGCPLRPPQAPRTGCRPPTPQPITLHPGRPTLGPDPCKPASPRTPYPPPTPYPSRVMEQKHMLEEQQTTLGVLSSMQAAAKAQKRTMQASLLKGPPQRAREGGPAPAAWRVPQTCACPKPARAPNPLTSPALLNPLPKPLPKPLLNPVLNPVLKPVPNPVLNPCRR
jgi:hypothetical protein